MRNLIIRSAILAGASILASGAMAQELNFWTWRAEDRTQYESFIEDFEAQNPGITVNFQAYEGTNYFTILSSSLAAGTGPDVMMVRAYNGLETVSNAGYLLALTDENVPALAGFPADAVASETSSVDGNVYAVPFASQTMLVIYNKDIFEQAGIEVPQTWDELLAAAETLKGAGLMPFANGTATAWQNESTFHALTASTFGRDFYEDVLSGAADFTDPRYIEALTRYQDISSKYFPDGFIGLDYASSQQLFISGLAGMFAGGSFELASFERQSPDINLGVFAAPGTNADDEKLVNVFYDGGFAANAASEHPEATLKFLNYLASKDFGQAFANSLNNVSPIPDLTIESELLQAVTDLNASSIPYLMFVNFRGQEPTGPATLQAEIQRMSAGQQTPEGIGQVLTDSVLSWYRAEKAE